MIRLVLSNSRNFPDLDARINLCALMSSVSSAVVVVVVVVVVVSSSFGSM